MLSLKKTSKLKDKVTENTKAKESITKIKKHNVFQGFQTGLVCIFVSALLVFILQFINSEWLIKPALQQSKDFWLNQQAELLALDVENQLNTYSSIISGFTHSNAFQKQLDNRSISAPFLAQLQVVLPFFKDVHVYFETPLLEDDVPIAITNVTLQSISLALQGKSVPAEVVAPGKAQEYLMLLQPVYRLNEDRTEGPVEAVILVALDRKILDSLFKSARQFSGYVEIQQIFGDRTVALTHAGDVRWKQGEGHTNQISNSQWQVSVWSSEAAMQAIIEQESLQWLFGGMGAGVCLLFGAIALAYIYSLTKNDSIVMVDYATESLKRGRWGLPPTMKIALWAIALDEISAFSKRFNHETSDMKAEEPESVASEPATEVPLPNTPPPLAQLDEVFDSEADAFSAPAHEEIVRELEFSSTAKSSDDKALLEAAKKEMMSFEEEALQKPSKDIFRAYDIRGVVGESLNKEHMYLIGRAVGSEIRALNQNSVLVARDARLSSPEFSESVVQGLMDAGCNVMDLGAVTTPMLYFACHESIIRHGVVVTGSHNPEQYNGLKIVINGSILSEGAIRKIYKRIEMDDYASGTGTLGTMAIHKQYLERITQDIVLARPLKVVVDCANAIAGEIAPKLLKALGCEVIELFCDLDGHFPNHHPDPSQPENMLLLSTAVVEHQADLGIAFDGDGDRLGVVDASGHLIWPDRQMMLFAMDLLTRNPGADIVFDVKCSRHLSKIIAQYGGRPVMYKTGHSLLHHKLKETGALLAGEFSGHIFFAERWYGFDDGLYAAARLLEILSADPRSSTEIFASLPESMATPELRLPMENELKVEFMSKLKAQADFSGAEVIDIDGLRVDYARGWGLVRISNTTPNLVMRFEADDELALSAIQDEFKQQLLKVDPKLKLPF